MQWVLKDMSRACFLGRRGEEFGGISDSWLNGCFSQPESWKAACVLLLKFRTKTEAERMLIGHRLADSVVGSWSSGFSGKPWWECLDALLWTSESSWDWGATKVIKLEHVK